MSYERLKDTGRIETLSLDDCLKICGVVWHGEPHLTEGHIDGVPQENPIVCISRHDGTLANTYSLIAQAIAPLLTTQVKCLVNGILLTSEPIDDLKIGDGRFKGERQTIEINYQLVPFQTRFLNWRRETPTASGTVLTSAQTK